MLGWEFPPIFSGGLGIVTYYLTKALVDAGADLTLLVPHFVYEKVKGKVSNRGIPFGQKGYNFTRKTIRINSKIHSPYLSYEKSASSSSHQFTRNKGTNSVDSALYGHNLIQEVERFARDALEATENETYDLIHAHDWITAQAALKIKEAKGIPFILHIHATEFDRSGETALDNEIYHREKTAMQEALHIITVSRYTKHILEQYYGIDGSKISVIYNAYNDPLPDEGTRYEKLWEKDNSEFWVIFMGRLTMQKGPDYFLAAAKKVIARNKKVHFLISGTGGMVEDVIHFIDREKLHKNIHYLGFLGQEERDALYVRADCMVVPSVSEPFGLTVVEGVKHSTPMIVSRTCGANEIIGHKLSVDFWDTDRIAEYILALQRYPALRRTLRKKSKEHFPDFTWHDQAQKIMAIYSQTLNIEYC